MVVVIEVREGRIYKCKFVTGSATGSGLERLSVIDQKSGKVLPYELIPFLSTLNRFNPFLLKSKLKNRRLTKQKLEYTVACTTVCNLYVSSLISN